MGYIIRKRVSTESFTDLIIKKLGLSIEELKEYQDRAIRDKKNLLQLLIDLGYSEEEIAQIKADYFGFVYDKLVNYIPEDYLLNIFDKNFLKSSNNKTADFREDRQSI